MAKKDMKIDQIDREIISILKSDSRVSDSKIAQELKRMGMEITDRAVNYRINRMLADGLIKFTIEENCDAMGKQFYITVIKFKPTISLLNPKLIKSLTKLDIDFSDSTTYVSYNGRYNFVTIANYEDPQRINRIIDKVKNTMGDYISEIDFWRVDTRITSRKIPGVVLEVKKWLERV